MFFPKFEAKLDPKVKTKWLQALRSRKFKQGKGQLQNIQGECPTYCCLGVLAEVQGLDSKDVELDESYLPTDIAQRLFNCDENTAQKLQSHLGTRNDGGSDYENTVDDKVIYHAPANGQKFYQIARWIERNL
jgi:hypothetical protein